MKKEGKLFLSAILFLLIASLIITSSYRISAEEEDPTMPLGLKPGEEPPTPEELKNKYLKQEWNKVIANSTFIGPIHKWAIANPMPFKIVFNEPYSFSLLFFTIFILWVFIAHAVGRIISKPKRVNSPMSAFKLQVSPPMSYIIGILFAVVLVHTGLVKWISSKTLSLIFAQSNGWIRTGLFAVAVILLVLLNVGVEILYKYFEEINLIAKDKTINQEIKESRAFREGVKEGQDILPKQTLSEKIKREAWIRARSKFK